MLCAWVLFFWDNSGKKESVQIPLSGLLRDSYQCVLSSQESVIVWCSKLGLGVKGG